jgi:hypothetical protein
MLNNDQKQICASWPPWLQHHAANGDFSPRARCRQQFNASALGLLRLSPVMIAPG